MLKSTGAISTNFIIELSTERVAFIPFYQIIKKQQCQEVIDFFLVAFHYQYQPASVRMLASKVIYDTFIHPSKNNKQVNLSDKMRKKVCFFTSMHFISTNH